MNDKKLFSAFVKESNPEHWREFPDIMWNLGFEMDCYESAPENCACIRDLQTEKERQDYILEKMNDWSTQEVGNFIFSRYRELTHWSDYGYPEEKGHYFFEKAFPILEKKLLAEWNARNTIPTIIEFTEIVASYLTRLLNNELPQRVKDFTFSDEGQFYLLEKYNECVIRYSNNKITAPMFRGRCARETAYYLKDLY